jgi:hypothetical protein
MDICAGGQISIGAKQVQFTNDHSVDCTITSCTMPQWPKTPPVIPKRQGGTPGVGIVQLTAPATQGKYDYTPNCCDKQNNPQIKVQ